MATTHQQGGNLEATNVVRPRPAHAAALAGGALLAAAALSMHQRGGVGDVEFVRRVEDAPGLWLTGHAVMGVAGILLVLGLAAVPGLVHGRGHRAVAIGSALAAVGAASTALGDFAHGSLAYVLIGEVSAEQSLRVQEQFYTQPVLAAAHATDGPACRGWARLARSDPRQGPAHRPVTRAQSRPGESPGRTGPARRRCRRTGTSPRQPAAARNSSERRVSKPAESAS